MPNLGSFYCVNNETIIIHKELEIRKMKILHVNKWWQLTQTCLIRMFIVLGIQGVED